MTDRFNLLELRQAAEDRDDDEPLGHVCMTGVYALALVEAVEAAKDTFAEIAAEAWADGDVQRMRRWAENAVDQINARFDFGEQT